MVDPYVEPTSGVLRNRFGITDAAELAKVEAQVAAIAELALYKEARAGGPHDLAQLRMVHGRLFGEVYDWAGELRTVDITKGSSLFAKAVHLESEAERIFGDLGRRDYLRGLGRAEFVREAGRLLADLNALHPFRDGNGRAQRAFLQLLARDGGWQFEWARVNAEVNTRLSAAAMVDPDALSPMLQDIVSEVGHRVLRTTWQCPVLHS